MYELSRRAYNVLVSDFPSWIQNNFPWSKNKSFILNRSRVIIYALWCCVESVICTGTRMYDRIVFKKNSRPSPMYTAWRACAPLRNDTRVYRYLVHIGHVRVVSQAGCKVPVSAIYQWRTDRILCYSPFVVSILPSSIPRVFVLLLLPRLSGQPVRTIAVCSEVALPREEGGGWRVAGSVANYFT